MSLSDAEKAQLYLEFRDRLSKEHIIIRKWVAVVLLSSVVAIGATVGVTDIVSIRTFSQSMAQKEIEKQLPEDFSEQVNGVLAESARLRDEMKIITTDFRQLHEDIGNEFGDRLEVAEQRVLKIISVLDATTEAAHHVIYKVHHNIAVADPGQDLVLGRREKSPGLIVNPSYIDRAKDALYAADELVVELASKPDTDSSKDNGEKDERQTPR